MVKSILLIVTFPIWLVQGIFVKKKAIRLPEANGDRFCKLNEDKITILGDSVAAGVGVEHISNGLAGHVLHELTLQLNRPVSLQVLAKSGDKLSDLVTNIESELYNVGKFVVISIGVNDAKGFTSRNQWRLLLIQLLDFITKKSEADIKIVLLAIPPMEKFPLIPFPLSHVLGVRSERLNQVTKEVVQQYHQVRIVDLSIDLDKSLFAIDGFHPSSKSCKLIAKEVVNSLLSQ